MNIDELQRSSALPHDYSHYRVALGDRSSGETRPALHRAVSRRFSCYSRIVSDENYQREARWARLGSATHADSSVAYAQRRLRCLDHVYSKVVSGKREKAGPVTRRCSVCTISSTQHDFAPIARSKADIWARTNRSQLTGVSAKTSCTIQRRTIPHKKSTKAITNKGHCVKNAVLTERNNNAANSNTRNMPKLADIVAYFKEYCESAGLHGVRYLSEDHRNSFERIFWWVTLILCAVGCACMIMKVKGKLDKSPVIVTFAEAETNICHLPFPAVTLCPYTIIQPSLFNVKKFSKKFQTNEDLFDDYISYLEKVESKIEITDKLFYQFNGSSMWVKENFSKRMYSDLYGDSMSEELTVLLEQMLRNNRSLLSRRVIDDNCKATSISQGVSPLEDHNLCKSIWSYYPVWVNETKLKMLALSPFCYIGPVWWEDTFKNSSFILDESAEKFFLKVASSDPFANGTGDSVWHYDYLPAGAWKEVWTSEGRCFTFNMINNGQIFKENVLVNHEMSSNDSETSTDWHPDKGYSSKAGPNTYPRRSFSSNHDSGLVMNLYEYLADIDYTCNFGRTGYKVILHRPEDQPQALLNYYVDIPFNRYASIFIKPTVMTTSPELEKYDAHMRQCYLSHEKYLKYFKFYSKNNCLLECVTNATLRKCGCVAFYMPRNASTKMCGVGFNDCMNSASEEVEIRDMNEHLKDISEREAGKSQSHVRKTECDCLPSCLSITYEADASISIMNPSNFLNLVISHEEENAFDNTSFTAALFNFKYKSFIASRRSELYGQIDFLANCGGLLGLFCGFSLISLIEFVYFLTIRLWSNIVCSWRNNRKIHRNSSSD